MKLTLPSGRVVDLAPPPGAPPPVPARGMPLFSDARTLLGALLGSQHDVDALALVDFHTLRAIAAHEGWLTEEDVTVDCVNCGAEIDVVPSKALPLGPFLEGSLHDHELDARLPTDRAHAIRAVALPTGGEARTITLQDLTVKEAAPLHAALGRERYEIDATFVRSMGIAALGKVTDARAIAEALDAASDEAWDDIEALFIDLHYPLRLFGVVRCEKCGARNDVDAPLEREFILGTRDDHDEDGNAGEGTRPGAGAGRDVPTFETFSERAQAIFQRAVAPAHAAETILVVEGGVPAVDEGGIGLLGSYVPEARGDAMVPTRPHEITVYYRTFVAMIREERDFDWEDELEETIEHEYEHLVAELGGGDPMDEAERREIAEEAIRIHGKKTLLKSEVGALGGDLVGFFKRTWILWVIIVAVAALMATR